MCAQKTHLPGYIFNRGNAPKSQTFLKSFFGKALLTPLKISGKYDIIMDTMSVPGFRWVFMCLCHIDIRKWWAVKSPFLPALFLSRRKDSVFSCLYSTTLVEVCQEIFYISFKRNNKRISFTTAYIKPMVKTAVIPTDRRFDSTVLPLFAIALLCNAWSKMVSQERKKRRRFLPLLRPFFGKRFFRSSERNGW